MPSKQIRDDILKQARRIVVKVGTNAICDTAGRLDMKIVRSLLKQIAVLMDRGLDVVLVASGAVGAGLGELDLSTRPKALPKLQATAAIGQSILMHHFHAIFRRYDRSVAQILVSRDDFKNRERILNIRQTLEALHELNCLPVVNENDAVATEELNLKYGDNDIIAANMTQMLKADVLVLLSSVDGVLDEAGRVVDLIEQVDQEALSLADDAKRSSHGSGGMVSKMTAAGMATASGEVAVITNSRIPNVLIKLFDGKKIGTVFLPAKKKRTSRQRWIGLSESVGTMTIDDGAVEALVQRGKSLLPSGVRKITGSFKSGDPVSIVSLRGKEIARGLAEFASKECRAIKGLNSTELAKKQNVSASQANRTVMIHRNNMTLM